MNNSFQRELQDFYIKYIAREPVMSVCKNTLKYVLIMMLFLPHFTLAAPEKNTETTSSILYQPTKTALAAQLGWIKDDQYFCGGYYLEEPFLYPQSDKQNVIETTGNQGVFSFHGTSIIKGKVTVNRAGQQITMNEAILYRDPDTGKIYAMDMLGDIHLREPNILVIGKKGYYNFRTKTKSLSNILYRTSVRDKKTKTVKKEDPSQEHKITSMTAWGQSHQFSQTQPKIYELSQASLTTCPPDHPAWQIKASHIVLDKNSGRGYATHARILVKDLPVFYFPYINFPIDNERKSGFLWPTMGISSKWGPYILTPFYWNIAPNYDMTITPGFLSKRNFQLSDNMRYLTETSTGNVNFSIIPNDHFFNDFQKAAPGRAAAGEYGEVNDVTLSELSRLESANTTRKGLSFRDDSQFNDHWSSHVDFNYASDDYFMEDFGSLNAISPNQLLQEGDLYYKGPNWNFIGRLQAYQTLHPIDQSQVLNQYQRLPQLILNGDYPDQALGLEYFINGEVTHFDIFKTPGTTEVLPIGNRLHLQPGVSLPLNWPYFYITPRLQLDMTQYQLSQTADTNTPNSKRVTVPIFDIASGLMFDRELSIFQRVFQQTLEPKVYYTYIPYRNQSSIPIFDTTVNTLTYDQLFNYNRFSGIDRIGDTNQLGAGISTRFIDQASGFEKVRLGIGEIFYFKNRRVTLCESASECFDYPGSYSNEQAVSPITGTMNYHIDPQWNFSIDAIFDPILKQLDNSTFGLHYKPEDRKIINFGYAYASSGSFSGVNLNSNAGNNLRITDFSFAWPLSASMSTVGRWSEDWHQSHLQNLLYGLQYDTCCWAVRMIGGRSLTTFNQTPQYNNEFYIQFALKGIGDIGSGNPGSLLSNITGYNPQFDRDF